MTTPINVTQPFLPPLEEFVPYLEKIWANQILTNNGPHHKELERALCEHLGVSNLSLFTNATIALVTALQSLRITGEVITTPYSFVATGHCLLWNNIKPVFVDIDSQSFNIDPDKIEEAITPQTTAIFPVHCYGNPCQVERIRDIADTYGLKVIYDAAHAFGVKYKGQSLLNYGDLSVLSFHATKVFNTFEGGAIISPDDKSKQRIDYLKNFGFANETTVMATGINGKMNEVSAAFGLLQLKYIDQVLARRRAIAQVYQGQLQDVPGIVLPAPQPDTEGNSAYYPILVDTAFPLSRDDVYHRMKEHGINCRRYFYPLISDFPMYRGLPSANAERLPVARRISDQVLCLPMYPQLSESDQGRIIQLLKGLVR